MFSPLVYDSMDWPEKILVGRSVVLCAPLSFEIINVRSSSEQSVNNTTKSVRINKWFIEPLSKRYFTIIQIENRVKERWEIKTENSIRFRFFSVSRLQFQIRFDSAFEFFESISVSFRIQPVPFDSCFRFLGSIRFRVKNWNWLENNRIWCIPRYDSFISYCISHFIFEIYSIPQL
jgi:hypothetical protein